MNQAITNTILNKYEEAKEDFACLIDRCPFWAAAYFNRAHLYCFLKQYHLAEEDLTTGTFFGNYFDKTKVVDIFVCRLQKKIARFICLDKLTQNQCV